MAIYRGTGGSAEATNSATVNEVASYAVDAETSATSAASSAASAASSATAASTSATASDSSATTSGSSATAAATSASASLASASNASTSASQSAASASSASTSASSATASATNAASSETAAASSATNASASASSASNSATNAANSASAAATSASASSVSADEAAASAASIVGSVAEATTKASEAAASAANAESAWDSFDDRYLGAKATEPTVDNDGNALVVGTMYFDSTNNVTMLYNGTEWQAASSSIDGIKTDFVYTATAGQTVFSGNDDNTNELVIDKVGLANVYLNGVRLSDSDYTASAPSNSITLSTGASVGDIVEVEVFGNFAGQSGADVAITGGSITGVTLNATGFTSTGIDDNATSTAVTIDANENVGIGTSSPTSPLHVSTSVNSSWATQIKHNGSTNAHGLLVSTGASSTGIPFAIYAKDSEAMRVDSSGNLLVGTTTSTPYVDSSGTGMAYRADFGIFSVKSAGIQSIIANRTGSDGAIAEFRKDGSTVGSIGSVAGVISYVTFDPRAHVGGTGTGLSASIASGSVPYISPRNGSGTALDGEIMLGRDNNRFKDLYLSGGVYLGGTGAANKLDDYEEGNFTAAITPTGGSVTLSASNLRYVKIGSSVTVGGRLTVGSVSSPTGAIQITLPFQAALYSLYTSVKVGVENSASKTYNDFTGLVFSGTSTFRVYLADSNVLSSSAANAQQLQATTNIDLSFTYTTNS